MKIEQQLQTAVIEAVKALYGQDITPEQVALQKTKKEFEGHLTLVVFGLLRISRKKPEDTAQEIGQWLKDNTSLLQSFNVVKGFLNLVIAPAQWITLLNDIDADDHFGITKPTEDSPLVMIEYSSPNTNKPLHLGHVRNNRRTVPRNVVFTALFDLKFFGLFQFLKSVRFEIFRGVLACVKRRL